MTSTTHEFKAFDYKGEKQTVKVRGELITNWSQTVYLVQTGKKRFAVVYGLQVSRDLDYVAASREFGQCVFHALACESLIEAPL